MHQTISSQFLSDHSAKAAGPCGLADRGSSTFNRFQFDDRLEEGWRDETAKVWVARTTQAHGCTKQSLVVSSSDRVVLLLALHESDIDFRNGRRLDFKGPVAAGTMLIVAPGVDIDATSHGMCDVLHLSVLKSFFDQQLALAGFGAPSRRPNFESFFVRDPLIEQIGNILVAGPRGWPRSYAAILGQLMVTRLLHLLPRRAPKAALPVWRLRKVKAFVEDHIADPLRLQDLADVAGLSRMHFAGQFRIATGYRPHSYVLHRRIERAKELMRRGDLTLVQVALDVGFQSQAHFCTIFKRLTGDTPSCWRCQAVISRTQPAPILLAAA